MNAQGTSVCEGSFGPGSLPRMGVQISGQYDARKNCSICLCLIVKFVQTSSRASMYVLHHLLPIACAIICLGNSAASTNASDLQDNASALSVTTIPFQYNTTPVSLDDRESQESEEIFIGIFL